MLDVWWLPVKSECGGWSLVTPPNRLFRQKRESADQPPTLKEQFLVKVQPILSISNFGVNWFDIPNRPLSLTTRRAEFYSRNVVLPQTR